MEIASWTWPEPLPLQVAEERDAHKIFQLGDFKLDSGVTLPSAFLAYKTWGTLSPAKDNIILLLIGFGQKHSDVDWLIGPHMATDPAKYFVIVVDMIGNGLSSSPSNTPPPYHQAAFPQVPGNVHPP